jgi:hypothetical protein
MPARVQLRRESNKAQGPELTELYNRRAKRTIRKSSSNGCAER